MDDAVRHALRRLARERGDSFAALSRLLGRNSAYVQQFMTRGSPARLEEGDRRTLATYFGVDEAVLGGVASERTGEPDTVRVPRLAVHASAGSGSIIESEFEIGFYRFDRHWLTEICRSKPDHVSIISVQGDSMSPTLNDGDDVLVDLAHDQMGLRDGIHVLRREGVLMVKRLAIAPMSGTLTIASDNAAYPTWRDCLPDSVTIVGRVVWIGRKLG